MRGFITERELEQADVEFPGILGFFQSLVAKPRTFLDLLSLFQRRHAAASDPVVQLQMGQAAGCGA
jgi:hypothetical protein